MTYTQTSCDKLKKPHNCYQITGGSGKYEEGLVRTDNGVVLITVVSATKKINHQWTFFEMTRDGRIYKAGIMGPVYTPKGIAIKAKRFSKGVVSGDIEWS